MNKIITISRGFGSGGRELGKRIAENLNIAYYDHEIITEIARRSGLAEDYVNSIVEKKGPMYYPITIGRTLSSQIRPQIELNTKIYIEQHNIIKELASKSDCVMIGRCSEYILRDHHPYSVFVYADIESRLQRCRQRAPENENLTDAEIKSKIRSIDKERARYHQFFTNQKWGGKENYSLCINTSSIEIKDMVLPLSELINAAFENRKERRD